MPKLPYETTLLGIPVTVASDEDCEKIAFRVCALRSDPTRFPDDDLSHACATCGVPLRVRPYGPHKPMKVCFTCCMALSPGAAH